MPKTSWGRQSLSLSGEVGDSVNDFDLFDHRSRDVKDAVAVAVDETLYKGYMTRLHRVVQHNSH